MNGVFMYNDDLLITEYELLDVLHIKLYSGLSIGIYEKENIDVLFFVGQQTHNKYINDVVRGRGIHSNLRIKRGKIWKIIST